MREPFITEAGRYELTAAEYHADMVVGGSLSSTGAKSLIRDTPAHFAWERENGREGKREFDFGRAAHTRVLGVGDETVVIRGTGKDPNAWRTNADKDAVKAAQDAGQTPITPADDRKIEAMAVALRRHPTAGPLLERPGVRESVWVWQDAGTGVWCRVMADFMPDVDDGGRRLVVDYKGLALDTAIPTADGWSTMRHLAVGDQIFDGNGRPCTVTAKSEVHWRTCYRIRFDDGSSVICDDEHLWATTVTLPSNKISRTPQVRTTDEIRRTLRMYRQCHHRIPVAGTLDLPELPLPIDPYVLGVWIGDGSAACGRVTSGDDETWCLIAARGYSTSSPNPKDPYTRTVYGLSRQLRLAGYLGHKQIPATYLRGSAQQRADLLRGLMDTDGSWNATRHQAVFTTVSKALAEQVRELALSLGQRAAITATAATGFGKTVTAYRVNFTPLGGLVPFALARKAAGVGTYPRARSNRRVVVAVEDVPTVPTQCITVDSPDRTYLCTEAMIPTHNTTADASPDGFAKSMASFGYDQQADWYTSGVHVLDPRDEPPQFVLIAQEKRAPYLVTVGFPEQDALTRGHLLNRRALAIYRECTDTGLWPGYPVEPVELRLPHWAVRELDGLLIGESA